LALTTRKLPWLILLPEFSALENVAMPLMLRADSQFKSVKAQAEYLLDRVFKNT
jgi:predicted ABC-type transport system involved in lysophospholipase L1 biosynthesis ATPase subunit